MKKVFGSDKAYGIWPDFEAEYNEHEYAWVMLKGLGEVLLLNYGLCDGPSDVRHACCKVCVGKRSETTKEANQKATAHKKERWNAISLCRIYAE